MRKNLKRMTVKILCSYTLIAGCIFFGAPNVQAQGWLDKTLKKAEKALNEVDKALKTDEKQQPSVVTETKAASPDYAGATIKCSNPKLNIKLESCIRDGELTTITYYITNNGNDVKVEYWGRMSMPDKQTKTAILDSEGNEYKWFDLSVGKEHSTGYSDGWLPTLDFPSGVKKKCTIVVKNVAKSAKKLSQVIISGWDFFLQFNNVPIYLPVDVLNKDKVVFAKEKPAVDEINAQTDLKWIITKVAITENNTQISAVAQQPNVIYTNNSPDFDPNAVITIKGKEYALFEAYGVPKYYFYGGSYGFSSAGQTRQYYFIFEKIPENTEVFDMKFGNIVWKNVWLRDPVKTGLNIPKTTGVLSPDDMYNKHDNRKRITAAERTALKINSIKKEGFDTKWTNSQLAAGKTIYTGKEGKLQTILYIEKEVAVQEFLVSYNAAGNVADCISIANISAYHGDRGEGTVEGVFVTSESFYPEGGGIDIYQITPELKFEFVKHVENAE